MSEVMRPAFWLAAVQIMGINILLSGDNAVVIALAVRALPPKERFWGMVLGAGAAAARIAGAGTVAGSLACLLPSTNMAVLRVPSLCVKVPCPFGWSSAQAPS